jgi:transcriptional regulator with XRE-family HTH domain
MAPTSPTVARWELALRIRQRRKQLGMTVATLCHELGFTPAYWSLIETYRNVFTEEKLLALLDTLEIDGDERDQLLALRVAAKEKGWWADYSTLTGEVGQRYCGLEHGAAGLRAYAVAQIPELLQTEDYARATISADTAAVRRLDVEPLVAIRVRRQQRLRGDDPLRLSAVIDEVALHRQPGGPDVARAQLAALVRAATRPNIDIRIVPRSVTPGMVAHLAPFQLLDFAAPALPTIAWYDSAAGPGIIEKPDHTRKLALALDHALAQALARTAAIGLIKSLME